MTAQISINGSPNLQTFSHVDSVADTVDCQQASDTEEGEEVVSLSDDDDDDQLMEQMEQQTVGRTWLVEFCLGALQVTGQTLTYCTVVHTFHSAA